jgi:DNA repair exonuclease SbcCD ATPase subunit
MELRYFKKHESIDVNFEQGLNGIVGANYKGKSTLLLGVMFCLGGARMVPGNRIATRGTNTGFRTALWFTIQGKGVFHVERTKTKANLWSLNAEGEETLMASGTSPVNNAISELLGMPLRRFAQIKFAKQKAADALLKYSSTELFQIVTELTGLGRIVEVLGMLETDLKVQRGIVEVLPYVDVTDKQAVLPELISDLTSLQLLRDGWVDKVSELTAKLKTAQADASLKTDQAFRLYKAKQAVESSGLTLFNAAQRNTAALEALAKTEGDGVGSAEALAHKEAQREQFLKQARAQQTLAGTIVALTKEVARLDGAEETLVGELDAANKAVNAIPAKQAKLVEEAKTTLQDLRTKKVQAEHDLAHAKTEQEGGVCRSCQRAFENFDPTVAASKVIDAERSLAALVKELGEVASQVKSDEQDLENYQRAQAKAERAELALRDFRSHATSVREDLVVKAKEQAAGDSADVLHQKAEDVLVEISAIRDLLATLNRVTAEAKTAATELANAESASTVAGQAYRSLLGEIGTDSTEALDSALAKVRGQVESLHADLAQANTEQRQHAENHSALNTRVRLLEQEIASAVANNDKAAAARTAVTRMESLQGMLRTNRDRYSRQVWDVFMASASMFASTVTGGAIESLARSESGAFTFMEDGFEMSLEEGSGAQLAIIGVAVQMALAEAAQCPLDILLMDEPTADMDAEHALAFSTLLAGSGKQTVIVTHREMDSAVFDNTITL